MRVFISQKMNGLTEEEVYRTRKNAQEYLVGKYGKVDIIESYIHQNVPNDAGRLWYLGESIKMMEKADGVYFCPGWEEAKGCQIEYEICRIYGLRILD